MRLNPGELVHEVTIQRLTPDEDPTGFPTETPATLLVARMSREYERGSEQFAAGQLSAPAFIRWTMPYHAQMDPDLVDVPKTRRLFYQSRAYDIVEAQVMGRKECITLRTLSNSAVAA